MSRGPLVWGTFVLCLALGLAVLGILSVTALRLDRAEAASRRDAQREEMARLALWRLDSALTAWLAEEAARPYFTYKPFYPAELAYTRMFAQIDKGMVWCPSDLLDGGSPYARLYFQIDPKGEFSSPQAPTGNMRDRAEPTLIDHETVVRCSTLLDELAGKIDRHELAKSLPKPAQRPTARTSGVWVDPGTKRGEKEQQSLLNKQEYAARSQSAYAVKDAATKSLNEMTAEAVSEGVLSARWQNGELLLARRVLVNEAEYVQGCWVHWEALRDRLLEQAREVCEGSTLMPVRGDEEDQGRMLAALPVRIELPPPPPVPEEWTPLEGALVLAWAGTGLAAAAIAALLQGAMSLSERRGVFVSAVTHELRTPLTTFRMYTEMLSEGMVADERRKRNYYDVLRTEADRLAHLVENVLAYAQLERGRESGRAGATTLAEVLERIKGRISAHARRCGMGLVVDVDPELLEIAVQTDPSAIEQVLFNLVDNACKYAGTAEDKRIHVELECDGRRAKLRVRDHGPGVAASRRRVLFRPFSKSAHDAAQTAAGVGLGLALSRRIARRLGGDLTLERGNDAGARFLLTLPLAPRPLSG